MAILSKALTLPILFTLILPTTFFACLTTFLAISVLLFRCGASKFITSQSTILENSHPTSPQPLFSTRRRRRRTSSASSTISATGSITPTALPRGSSFSNEYAVLTSPNSCIGLNTSIGPTRDFEGVGGWRFAVPSEEDDGLWTKINSRLELPADHGRRHKRSLTSGSLPTMSKEVRRGRFREDDKEGEKESGNGGTGNSMNSGRTRSPPTTLLGDTVTCIGEGTFEKGVLMMGGSKSKKSSSGSTSSSGNSRKEGLSVKAR